MDDLQDIRSRLRNWVRYRFVRYGDGPPFPRCALGTLYVAPYPEKGKTRYHPDLLDGFLLDRTICSLPLKNRDTIMVHYLGWVWFHGRRMPVGTMGECCRVLAVSRRTYYRMLERSQFMLRNILLTRGTKERKLPPKSCRLAEYSRYQARSAKA